MSELPLESRLSALESSFESIEPTLSRLSEQLGTTPGLAWHQPGMEWIQMQTENPLDEGESRCDSCIHAGIIEFGDSDGPIRGCCHPAASRIIQRDNEEHRIVTACAHWDPGLGAE